MSTSAPLASSDANALNNASDGQKILADLSKSDDDASSLNYSVATDNAPAAEESGVVVSGGLAAAGAAGLAAVNSTDDLADDANLAADPLEDDVVLTHKSSTPRKLLTSRPALLLALLAILIIGLSVGLSNRNNGANATATGGSGADIEVKAATAAAVPASTKNKDKNEPNNKKDGNKEPAPAPIVPGGSPFPTDQSTPFPTNQGTETVGIDASFGPTTPPRGDSDWRRKNRNRRVNVIQSPTWHG